jgi:CMP-N-acetylneuraminic acid synthetase
MTAIAHVAQKYSQVARVTLDAVIDLDICNPMRHWQDIATALELYRSHHGPNSVVSATPARRSPYFNMVVAHDGQYGDVDIIVGDTVNRRQDAPQVWDLNSCIYVYNPEFLASHTHPVGTRTYCYPMPPHTFCDIDHPLDLIIVTHLMKEYGYV